MNDPYADDSEHIEAYQRVRTPEEQRARADARRERKHRYRDEYWAAVERLEFLEAEYSRLKVKCGEIDE